MPSFDQLEAFIYAAEHGSFSAAARKLNKAQSAVSSAIINLEIETGVELFDRTSRSPSLTQQGKALLKQAQATLNCSHDFMAQANSLNANEETQLSLAIEQSVSLTALLPLLTAFEQKFPFIELELLDPGTNDVASLIRNGRAELGLMIEQEHYPQGFKFKGIGYSNVIALCHKNHPLAQLRAVNHNELRQHRQIVTRSLDLADTSHRKQIISPKFWLAESPYIIVEILAQGIGWSLLHEAVAAPRLDLGELVKLNLDYQQVSAQQGIDVVWTDKKALGTAGLWLKEQLFKVQFTHK